MSRQVPLSDQIRELIDSADESRYRIAINTGIDHATISRFMSGERGLTLECLDTLADYLGWRIIADKKRRQKG